MHYNLHVQIQYSIVVRTILGKWTFSGFVREQEQQETPGSMQMRGDDYDIGGDCFVLSEI